MKTRILKGFAYIWLIAAGIVILAGIYGVWTQEGFSAVQDLLSPFNLVNWLFTVILISPAIGALMWADKISKSE